MKKLYVLLLLGTFLIAFSSSAFSMDYLLGAKCGYYMWDAWLQEASPQFENMDTGSGVLYGPVASVTFTQDLSLSVAGLFGNQETHGTSKNIRVDSTTRKTTKFSFDTFRMDIDSALNYRLTENIKIFAGYKYWYLKTKYDGIDYRYDNSNVLTEVFQDKIEITQPFHGPGLGTGFSMPLGNKGFFVAANISGIYMVGKFEMKFKSGTEFKSSGWVYTERTGHDVTLDMHMFGINIEPTIGLRTGESLPIMTLGVRYQYNKFKVKGSMPDHVENMNTGWMTDKIYGVFVAVLYQI